MSNVIRFPLRLASADMRAIQSLIRDHDETPVPSRIGPEGEHQVRCSSGEIYNLCSVPKFQVRQLASGINGNRRPPGGAAAMVA